MLGGPTHCVFWESDRGRRGGGRGAGLSEQKCNSSDHGSRFTSIGGHILVKDHRQALREPLPGLARALRPLEPPRGAAADSTGRRPCREALARPPAPWGCPWRRQRLRAGLAARGVAVGRSAEPFCGPGTPPALSRCSAGALVVVRIEGGGAGAGERVSQSKSVTPLTMVRDSPTLVAISS